ncbi:MAG: ABC transporter ATP-binding protein [Pseudomonadota bacterium]
MRDVSIAFRPGRLTALCGANGSGKSTRLGVASGKLRVWARAATLLGQDVATMSLKECARCLAMLPQSPDAPAELAVRDLVAPGRYAQTRPLAELTVADRAAVAAELEAMEVSDLADRALSELAVGQRQRA